MHALRVLRTRRHFAIIPKSTIKVAKLKKFFVGITLYIVHKVAKFEISQKVEKKGCSQGTQKITRKTLYKCSPEHIRFCNFSTAQMARKAKKIAEDK